MELEGSSKEQRRLEGEDRRGHSAIQQFFVEVPASLCTVVFLQSGSWYSGNPDTLAVEENSPKCRSFGKSVSTSIIVASPDSLSPTPSTSSAMKTPDPQFPGPSACLVETEETPENTQRDSDAPEPAAEGEIQMEYSSGQLWSSSIGAVTKNYL